MIVCVAALLLVAGIGGVVWTFGGVSAVLYAILVALAAASGLPLGFAVFGRHHAAGWIAGLLLGYALTALACWAVIFLGLASAPAFITAWALLLVAVAAAATGMRSPAVSLPTWRRADTIALLFVLLLVPAIVGPPLARVGTADETGSRQYRAYFTVDFLWHTALVAELAKFARPPRNPYAAAEPLHYYWIYFLLPAAIVEETDIEAMDALKVNAVGAALLFLAAIYLTAWVALPAHPMAVGAGVALTVVAASAEGLAALVDFWLGGQPWEDLRNLNIDALAAWALGGLRIDNLPRSMWYNPQHSTACALGLLAMPVAIAGGVSTSRTGVLAVGAALGAAVMFNPFVGAVFSAVYGAAVLIDAARRRAAPRAILRQALAAVPVIAALGWVAGNHVTTGVGDVIHLGPLGPAREAPVLTLLLSFGPILVPLAIAVWPFRSAPLTRLWPACFGMALSVWLMFFVTLTVDLFWVGFRASQIFFVLAPALVARGFIRLSAAGRPLAAAVAGLVLAAGLPTTLIDFHNAQDVSHRGRGPGFRWTVLITPAEQEALDWIRTRTLPDAVVQPEPTVRGRETWSLIPSFAERRMAAGLALSLLGGTQPTDRTAKVRDLFETNDPERASHIAKALGIDYLYAGAVERAAYPGTVKFDRNPAYFTPVFRNEEVGVYAVVRVDEVPNP